jgi:hypothetical protein
MVLGRWRVAVAALSVLAWLYAAAHVYRLGEKRPAIDLYIHWAVVHAVRDHIVPSIYSDDARQKLARAFAERASRDDASEVEKFAFATNMGLYDARIQTVGTPALYALVSPFVTDDYDVDRRTFLIVQLGAVAGAFVIFAVASGLPAWVGLLLAGWAGWFFEPVISDLIVGSVSSLQWLGLGLVVLASRARASLRRDAFIGAALGFAAIVKPNLLLVFATVLLPLAVDRRVRALGASLAGAAGGALVCVVGSSAWFGNPSVWWQWAQVLPMLTVQQAGVEEGNIGLVATLREITHHRLPLPLALLVGASCLVAMMRTRKPGTPRSADEVLFAVAAGGAATALIYPLFWVHYGVLVVPAALVGWRWAKGGARWVVALAALAMSSLPRMARDDMLDFAVGVGVAEIALFAFALAAWADARSRAVGSNQ